MFKPHSEGLTGTQINEYYFMDLSLYSKRAAVQISHVVAIEHTF
jgi:hypothetical protein